VSPIQVVPKKGGMTVVENSKNELIQWIVTGWRMCIDYYKLNSATRKDHFPLPFIHEMLERWAKHLSSISLMGIKVITKSPSTPTIRAKPLSLAHMECMLIEGCHLGFAMHSHHSKGAWHQSSLTWSKRLWRSLWMISLFMGKPSIIVLRTWTRFCRDAKRRTWC
jgi:hypothetical protein